MQRLSTKQAARLLSERCQRHVTPNLLHALIINDRLTPPAKNVHGFFEWTLQNLDAAAQALATDRRRREHRSQPPAA